MKSQEEFQDAAERAFELLEQKSPHQLAVELAHLQRKHAIAVSAVNKIGAQRDQLAAQLKDATAQCAVAADLLRELRDGAEIHLHNCIVCKNEQGIANWTSKLERIDALLVGQVPEQAVDAHPMQPILLDPAGRPRFKKNSAIEYLAEGRLNEVASRGYSDEDMTQLAQLIGYSVDGFGELSCVSDADYERAVAATPKPEGGA